MGVGPKWTIFNVSLVVGSLAVGGPKCPYGRETREPDHLTCDRSLTSCVAVTRGTPVNRLRERPDWKHFLPANYLCVQWRIQHFLGEGTNSRGDAPTDYLLNGLPKTAWKWKNLERESLWPYYCHISNFAAIFALTFQANLSEYQLGRQRMMKCDFLTLLM